MSNFVSVKTMAKELSTGVVIRNQVLGVKGVWCVVKDGLAHCAMLCRPTTITVGRTTTTTYEWMSFCCQGKGFVSHEEAVTYINSLPA